MRLLNNRTIERAWRLLVGEHQVGKDEEARRQQVVAIGICLIGSAALLSFGMAALVAGNFPLAAREDR